jgi:hypothetical protein
LEGTDNLVRTREGASRSSFWYGRYEGWERRIGSQERSKQIKKVAMLFVKRVQALISRKMFVE